LGDQKLEKDEKTMKKTEEESVASETRRCRVELKVKKKREKKRGRITGWAFWLAFGLGLAGGHGMTRRYSFTLRCCCWDLLEADERAIEIYPSNRHGRNGQLFLPTSSSSWSPTAELCAF
jgi:hypothetical protein